MSNTDYLDLSQIDNTSESETPFRDWSRNINGTVQSGQNDFKKIDDFAKVIGGDINATYSGRNLNLQLKNTHGELIGAGTDITISDNVYIVDYNSPNYTEAVEAYEEGKAVLLQLIYTQSSITHYYWFIANCFEDDVLYFFSMQGHPESLGIDTSDRTRFVLNTPLLILFDDNTWSFDYTQEDYFENVNIQSKISVNPQSTTQKLNGLTIDGVSYEIEGGGGSGLPDPPSTDGKYILKCTVNNGVAVYSWENDYVDGDNIGY